MKRSLTLAIAFFQFTFLHGQSPWVKQWDYRYGANYQEILSGLLETADGSLVLAGFSASNVNGDKTDSTKGSFDFWLFKTDANGIKLWDKAIGGSGDDKLTSIAQTTDGGFILGGTSLSDSSGDKSQNNWDSVFSTMDYWIVKLDSSGTIEWERTLGGTRSDWLTSVCQAHDGGFIAAGFSESDDNGSKTKSNRDTMLNSADYYIVKLDSQGNTEWDMVYGGIKDDLLSRVMLTNDHGFLLAGSSNSPVSGDKSQALWGTWDYWIVKIDSMGNKVWDQDIGGNSKDELLAMNLTDEGGFILAGISASDSSGNKTQSPCGGPSYDDIWIVKTDSLGIVEWDRQCGGNNYEDDVGTVLQTNANDFLIGATSYSPISCEKSDTNLGLEQQWIVKLDSVGSFQWDKTILTTGHDEIAYILQTNDGCFLVAGYTDAGAGGDKTQGTRGMLDYWMIKFCDTNAAVKPVVNLSSSDTIFCEKQCIDFNDLSSNSPTSWQWSFPGAVPPSSTLQNPTGICYNSYGIFDVTLIACNSAGCDTLYLPNFINEFQNPPVPVVTVNIDTLFSSPAYSYQWYFNSNVIPGATGQYYVFQQQGNYYVIVTDSNGCAASSPGINTGINDNFQNSGFYFFANPSDGNISLEISVNTIIRLFDIAGRMIFTKKISS